MLRVVGWLMDATGLSSLAVKAILSVGAVAVLLGAIALYNANLRQQGADKHINKQIKDDNETLREKVKRDDEIRNEDDDALLDRFEP